TLLLPGFGRYLARRSGRAARRRPAALGFFLLCFGWCLAFFSAAGCKRHTYLLPALPSLALALGCYLAVLAPPVARASFWQTVWQRGSRLAHHATLLVLVLGLVIPCVAIALGFVKLHVGVALTALALGGVGLWLLSPRRLSWAGCAVVTFLALYLG